VTQIKETELSKSGPETSGFLIVELEEISESQKQEFQQGRKATFNQILLITQGGGCIELDSDTTAFTSGSLISIQKGLVSRLHLDEKAQGYIIMFSDDILCEYPEDNAWIIDLTILGPLASPVILFSNANDFTTLVTMLQRMLYEFAVDKGFAHHDILINTLRIFLLFCERAKRSQTHSLAPTEPGWDYITAFRKALDEQICTSRSVQHYADYLRITRKRLNLATGKFLGKSAKKVIEERVILEVKRLLLYTRDSVKEIGFTLGFSDPTNFNKFFKKHAGTSPAEFRKAHRGHNRTINSRELTI
jgi:AraC-like DNA-binding protein